MKTLQQIKDEYAKEKGYVDYSHAFSEIDDEDFDEIAKRYARECCKASLEKAAGNATTMEEVMGEDGYHEYIEIVNKESITNEENIVLL